jgi:hypothetical protein
MVYLLASGIDIANDRLIAGIESVLGADVARRQLDRRVASTT